MFHSIRVLGLGISHAQACWWLEALEVIYKARCQQGSQ